MLRKLRILLATLVMAVVIVLFVAPWEGDPWPLGFISEWQLVPAILAGNLLIIGILALITILFGRLYCSVICPLGILQDVISWLSGLRKGKKLRFTPSKEMTWLRYGVFVLFVAALIAGVSVVVALLEPYSAFGRIFASATGQIITISTCVVAGATLIIIAILSWKNGRTWCNTICPVGTTLGFLSRFAIFRPVINASKCKDCHACEKKCKASCIDIAAKKIDYSRCVDCFDCLDSCKFGALKYSSEREAEDVRISRHWLPKREGPHEVGRTGDAEHPSPTTRRAFLSAGLLAIGGAAMHAQSKKVDGGFAAIEGKKAPERSVPITPFGSGSVKDFYRKCTACQLCVSACPNDVLRPSTSLEHLMQPEMSYENGYCRPECTDCSKVCPSDAILPLTPAEKTHEKIGLARVDRELCVVSRDGVNCGNCARHCPVGAIRMVPLDASDPHGLRIPAVDESRCIGCGACEYLCPSRPYSAITVNGLHVHIKD
ncbi:MAG: 4Fe-4S dicluster domain-containing protein [Bacteroidales bacterium]|nr:4Fe-4S dicluster domain-containing protein [Bacteroidales bacterium]